MNEWNRTNRVQNQTISVQMTPNQGRNSAFSNLEIRKERRDWVRVLHVKAC